MTNTVFRLDQISITGWIPITATWTRTGNHTFTVSGDVTATYRKGTKVRYKDGGSYEYGVIQSSSYGAPNTTITLITNSDYAMAAATITDTYISYIENPEGWPGWFNYTPTLSASGSMTYTSTTVDYCMWNCHGRIVEFKHRVYGTLGGTVSSSVYVTSPTPINLATNGAFLSTIVDTATSVGRGITIVATGLLAHKRLDEGNWTLGASKYAIGEGNYPL